MLKKQTIALAISSLLALGAAIAQAATPADDFARFKQSMQTEFQTFSQENKEAFARFVQQWRDAESSVKDEISQSWPDARLPDATNWIKYSENRHQRTIIDYKHKQINIEIMDQRLDDNQAIELIRQRIQQMGGKTLYEAASNDPVHQRSGLGVNAQYLDSKQTLLSRDEVASSQKVQPQIQRQGNKTSISIKLPATATHKRAGDFMEPAKRHAGNYNLPPELILAVIHTESSFNPMARSHIPAFGLMQIVPQSAGKDVTEYLTGNAYLLTPEQLYNSETNIRAGSVYLHLLHARYFKNVTNDVNRLLMSIAAYNTGPGNVARALTGTTSLTAAARKANTMTPDQMYQHLLNHLPYAETRNYLKRVSERQVSYAKLMENR